MSFFGKIAKITSITMMAAGGAVVVCSAAMLGVGCNYTYTQYNFGLKLTAGVGAMNYDKGWINGKPLPFPSSPNTSYTEFVKQSRQMRKLVENEINSLPPETPQHEINLLKKSLKVYYAVETAYSLMIVGSLFVSISSLTLIAGIILFAINMKKQY